MICALLGYYPALRSRSSGHTPSDNWLVKYHADESLVIPVLFQCNRRDGCNKELRPRVLIHEFLDRTVSRRAQALAEIDSPCRSLRACAPAPCWNVRAGGCAK